jgi:hypothetical protein
MIALFIGIDAIVTLGAAVLVLLIFGATLAGVVL